MRGSCGSGDGVRRDGRARERGLVRSSQRCLGKVLDKLTASSWTHVWGEKRRWRWEGEREERVPLFLGGPISNSRLVRQASEHLASLSLVLLAGFLSSDGTQRGTASSLSPGNPRAFIVLVDYPSPFLLPSSFSIPAPTTQNGAQSTAARSSELSSKPVGPSRRLHPSSTGQAGYQLAGFRSPTPSCRCQYVFLLRETPQLTFPLFSRNTSLA